MSTPPAPRSPGAQPAALAAFARALWDALDVALADANNADTQALAGCAEQLRAALHSDASARHAAADAAPALDALAADAHARMGEAYRRASSTLPWRRLYTDACILRACVDVRDGAREADIVEAVARLDKAIIIAGPAGEGRLELILEFVAQLQAALPPTPSDTPSHTYASSPPPSPPLPSRTPIPQLSPAPSLASFLTTHSQTPFILAGFAHDWPALTSRPWASQAYLRAAAGPARVVPVEVGRDYRAEDWRPAFARWDAFLHALAAAEAPRPRAAGPEAGPEAGASGAGADEAGEGERVLYLAQHDLLKQFPALRADVAVPDYAYAAPSAPADFPAYRAPPNEEALVLNAWFGPGGTVSPAHTDPFFNLYTQIVGHKTVWLAPPHTSPHMHAYSPSPPSTSSPSSPTPSTRNPAANSTAPLLSNTSALDVFADAAELPEVFVRNVVPHAMAATLAPGDVLFFPPGWWHAMRAEQTSFSVSMWF